MKEPCLQLRTDYKLILSLKNAFDTQLPKATETRDFKIILQAKAVLDQAIRNAWDKIYCPPEKAKKILGPDYLGPEAVLHALGVDLKPEEIPPMPFKRWEIERAKELGMFLVLRVNKMRNGESITIKNLNETYDLKISNAENYSNYRFYNKATPLYGWALVSKELIGESGEIKNYLEQTEILCSYIKEKIFKDADLPEYIQKAVDEFEEFVKKNPELQKDNNNLVQELTIKLADLKINKLFRQIPVEVIYDNFVYNKVNGVWLTDNISIWTSTALKDSARIYICVTGGGSMTSIDGILIRGKVQQLGTVFSRTK